MYVIRGCANCAGQVIRRFLEGVSFKDPILVTRRGRLAGVFFPRPEASLPIELKPELFAVLSSEIARQLHKRGPKEEEIVAEFQSWRKRKRETRRRRNVPTAQLLQLCEHPELEDELLVQPTSINLQLYSLSELPLLLIEAVEAVDTQLNGCRNMQQVRRRGP